MHFFPEPCYVFVLKSNYSPQYLVLKYFQSMFFS
jgi:hypothetical protein